MSVVVRQAGNYDVVGEIGDRGGMAVVYLARQPRLDREVALKQVDLRGGGELVERFVREAKLAGSLNHPNIVTVHDFFEDHGTPYIAMEYLPRGSLRPWIGGLSLPQTVGVLEGVLAGLAHAHGEGLVHRDIKPENILVTNSGGIKLADFGIARAFARVTGRLTKTGMTVGTPAYMAPEQALDRELGPWTDLYATGVVAYEMLLGRLPFEETDTPIAVLLQHVNHPIPRPRALDPALDTAIAAWLESMLAKAPEQRPDSAQAAWERLEEATVSVAGPLWRRDARLVEPAEATDATAQLTPAPFQPPRTTEPPDPGHESHADQPPFQPEAIAEYTTYRAPPPPRPPMLAPLIRGAPAASGGQVPTPARPPAIPPFVDSGGEVNAARAAGAESASLAAALRTTLAPVAPPSGGKAPPHLVHAPALRSAGRRERTRLWWTPPAGIVALVLVTLATVATVSRSSGGAATTGIASGLSSPRATATAPRAARAHPDLERRSNAARRGRAGAPAHESNGAAAAALPELRTHIGVGYRAKLPTGAGWGRPVATEPTRGRLYRTTVRGPAGMFVLIDSTPAEPAVFSGSFSTKRNAGRTAFGAAQEFVFRGGALAECQRTRCVDYIINDHGSRAGVAVLAGGPDFQVARRLAREIMESVTGA